MWRSSLAVLLMALAGAAHAALHGSSQAGPAAVDPRLMRVLAAEEDRASTAAHLEALAEGVRTGEPAIQAAAARALGRLERRDVVPLVLPLLSAGDADVRSEAANAVAQSFRGPAPHESAAAAEVGAALRALVAAPRTDALHRAVGRLPYETVDQFRTAESFLLEPLREALPPAAAARALESLGRRRPSLAPLSDPTVDRLREIAGRRTPRSLPADVRRNAMAALVTWQGADAPTIETALTDEDFEIRRLATLVIAGAGGTFTAEQRRHFLTVGLQDRSPHVRLEAVRAWARRAAGEHGCAPIVHAVRDADLHVVLAALDALGEQCTDDDQITVLLAAEARTPPPAGRWQREAHAFVALAKRSRERASITMPAFSTHADWQVRLYAARAAAAIDDLDTLRHLAMDPDDNVVEATLGPLRARLGAASDELFVAALNRRTRTEGRAVPARPYQVWREAALRLQGAEATGELLGALAGALQRATADSCLTSRDTRLALIARLGALGSAAQAPVLAPLLKDIDPRVAEAAADAIQKWTGKRPLAEPRRSQPDLPSSGTLRENPLVMVEMETGRLFRLAFFSNQAPLTKARIIRLVRERYYDGLAFHRVVPNFVIQGGGPNANEFCGDCPFMRDEVGLTMHVRGTVGVSTRGRDTGDAQLFVNLVDNARLDHEYTVFAHVCPTDMAVVDGIHEGDRMRRVTLVSKNTVSCPAPR